MPRRGLIAPVRDRTVTQKILYLQLYLASDLTPLPPSPNFASVTAQSTLEPNALTIAYALLSTQSRNARPRRHPQQSQRTAAIPWLSCRRSRLRCSSPPPVWTCAASHFVALLSTQPPLPKTKDTKEVAAALMRATAVAQPLLLNSWQVLAMMAKATAHAALLSKAAGVAAATYRRLLERCGSCRTGCQLTAAAPLEAGSMG